MVLLVGGGIGCLFEGTSVVRKNFQSSEGLAVLSPGEPLQLESVES